MEQSKSYDDNKLEMLQNLNEAILQIREENIKQKSLFDFFKKI